MSSWVGILVLVFGVYLLVKLFQGLVDFVAWYKEGRAFAVEQKRRNEKRRAELRTRSAMPALKERPEHGRHSGRQGGPQPGAPL